MVIAVTPQFNGPGELTSRDFDVAMLRRRLMSLGGLGIESQVGAPADGTMAAVPTSWWQSLITSGTNTANAILQARLSHPDVAAGTTVVSTPDGGYTITKQDPRYPTNVTAGLNTNMIIMIAIAGLGAILLLKR